MHFFKRNAVGNALAHAQLAGQVAPRVRVRVAGVVEVFGLDRAV